jgi:hypothetical protein
MSAPTSAPVADDKSLPAQSAVDELPVQIEDDAERTKSSLARFLQRPELAIAMRDNNTGGDA